MFLLVLAYPGCPGSKAVKRSLLLLLLLFLVCYIDVYVCEQLESAEDVHVLVDPGTYAVTAGEWGTTRRQTHLVRVSSGQSVNVDFVV